jgi:peptidyl-prolyl cis-trans isomerase C
MPITVNDVTIPDQAVFAEMQHHPANGVAEAQRQAAEALVVRQLLLQEAAHCGFAADESGIEALLAQALDLPEPDEASCRRYYENNQRRFRTPDLLEARHILLAAAPDDLAARDDAKAKAAALVASVAADRSRFATLAAEHSACPSKANGGHLGQITRGSLVPELETYLFAMNAGELCPVPVASRYGWHVIEVLARADGRELPFDRARKRIADYLVENAWRRAFAQYVSLLAGRSRIVGVEFRAANSPLVQ